MSKYDAQKWPLWWRLRIESFPGLASLYIKLFLQNVGQASIGGVFLIGQMQYARTIKFAMIPWWAEDFLLVHQQLLCPLSQKDNLSTCKHKHSEIIESKHEIWHEVWGIIQCQGVQWQPFIHSGEFASQSCGNYPSWSNECSCQLNVATTTRILANR